MAAIRRGSTAAILETRHGSSRVLIDADGAVTPTSLVGSQDRPRGVAIDSTH